MKKNGFAAIYLVILVLASVLTITASLFMMTFRQNNILRNAVKSSQTYYAAEAGLEDAVYRIKSQKNIFANYSVAVGSSSTGVLVSSPSQNNKIITASTTVAGISKTLAAQLNISSVSPQFFYGAQVGDLGLKMDNNSRVEGASGTVGNIYSNGSVEGAGGATITGTVFVATGMAQDQSDVAYNADQIFGKDNPIIDLAQSFVPSASDALVRVSLYIKRVGEPNNATVRILTNNGSSPSKTVLASEQLNEDLVGTALGWVNIAFSSPPNLAAGTVYWLTLDASRDNNDYWVWGKDQNGGYASGTAKYSPDWNASSPLWTTLGGDLNFKTFTGGQATALTQVNVGIDAHANSIVDSTINGNAYYQTISDSTVLGTKFPGSSDPPLQNMPISESNINQWKQAAGEGGVYSGDLTISSNTSYGPKKIDGNLLLTSNNKTLTVTGTIYVTGYIDIDNGSRIRCDASYGLSSCLVIADKWIHVQNNGVFSGSGMAGSYVTILTTSNCDGSFSTDCTHHNAAMELHNGATGAIFYANDGLIYLRNGVIVSEIAADKIHLDQNAIIRYEQGLQNVSFSSGPGGSWEIISWQEI